MSSNAGTTTYAPATSGPGAGGAAGATEGRSGSAGADGTVVFTALNQAIIASATPGELHIAVSWTQPSQPAGLTVSYQVYVDGLAVSGATSSPATVTGLTFGDSYEITVVATTSEGLPTTSAAATASPTAPIPDLTVVSSLNPSTFGTSVLFTATIEPAAATGTVTFKDGATTLGTGTLSGGAATYSTAALGVGSHGITAEYGGDLSYAASTSSELSQTVNKATPSVTAWPTAIGIVSSPTWKTAAPCSSTSGV